MCRIVADLYIKRIVGDPNAMVADLGERKEGQWLWVWMWQRELFQWEYDLLNKLHMLLLTNVVLDVGGIDMWKWLTNLEWGCPSIYTLSCSLKL